MPAPSAAWLAEQLIGRSWCSCQAWSLGGYLFLNDQTCADGAFEVAIVKPPAEPGGQWWQVESTTFGWLTSPLVINQHSAERGRFVTPSELSLEYITRAVSGEFDPGQPGSVAWPIEACRVETPEQHGRCGHCA
jgi:hypothetical protein